MTALALFKVISTTFAAHITHKRVWRLLVRSVSRHPELHKAQGSPNRPSSDNIIVDKQSRDDPDDNASWSDLEGIVVSLRVVLKRCAPASIRGSLSLYLYIYIYIWVQISPSLQKIWNRYCQRPSDRAS
jgi:hypothetical protein